MLFFLTVCNCCCFFQLGGLQGGHSPHVSGLGLHHHERKQSHVDGGTRYVGWRITDKHNLFLTSPFWSLLSLTLSCSLSWPNLDYVLTYLNLYFRKNSVSVHQQYERPRRIDQSHPEVTRVSGLWRFDFTDRGKQMPIQSNIPVKHPCAHPHYPNQWPLLTLVLVLVLARRGYYALYRLILSVCYAIPSKFLDIALRSCWRSCPYTICALLVRNTPDHTTNDHDPTITHHLVYPRPTYLINICATHYTLVNVHLINLILLIITHLAIPCGMDFGFTFKWIAYGNNYFKEVDVVTN